MVERRREWSVTIYVLEGVELRVTLEVAVILPTTRAEVNEIII
jgi:hypothetical protein